MSKFKVGDVLDNTGYTYSFFSKGGYVVYENNLGLLAIKDDDGAVFVISGSDRDCSWAARCFTARPTRPDPLDYLKATIRSLVGCTSIYAAGQREALIQMAKDVYGLDTVFVPASADFVPVTQ